MRSVVAVLSARRFRLSSERPLQDDIAAAFTACGIAFEREFRLSAEDRPDFLVAGVVAVEVKIKGGRVKIYRQCERYCAHVAVTGLVLATNVAMALPPLICGKPAAVVTFGRAWL